ncbi:acyl-CoA dehydratase activase-related protein, partial [Streptococcus suis]
SLAKAFADYEDMTIEAITKAVEHGYQVLADFKKDLQDRADELLTSLSINGEKAIVLSGRPYHLDPEINHGIANIITQEGVHVLTEDMVSGLEEVGGLRVVNQWVYHSRLYAAAKIVAKNPNLEL